MNIYDLNSRVSEKLLKFYLLRKYNSIIKEVSIKQLAMLYQLEIDSSLYSYRFDYLDFDTKTLIEFDGEQHFQSVDFFGGDEAFEVRRESDIIKQRFVVENDFHLIRIREGTTLEQLNAILNKYQNRVVEEKCHLFIHRDEFIILKHDELQTNVQFSSDTKINHDTVVNKSDMSYTFIEDTIDKINGIQYVSTKHLYMMFVDWCKINQPTTRIKSNVSFTKEVSKYLARYGYKLEHQRKSFNLSNNSIQAMIKYQAKLSNFDKSEQSQYFEKMIDPIDEKELNEVKSKLDKNEINLQNHHELTQRELICIEYLATDGHTTATQFVD